MDDYVLGHVIRDVLEGRSGHGRMSPEERDEVFLPYLMDLVRGGGFPNLAPLLEQGVPVADDNFERGLKWLLDGLAAELSLP
ncbi:hypothetical protein Ssi03_52260 [Sphaerisporangium siamense]|uniref:Tetracycline repressor TetR C-terminal domain-containing protein n=1 Tax=Sphaerisporangium siamense TaxID=795645 RepID=A0A7W7D853_9ACTN|nr:TetR/AcrR family transcriptional regulator C-terminal domain-containing protein [Sphaerisporangium siamense]MBB4702073.1 hypothetical protein [Sphaerisporangium siamense]GII87236.1 hypothetical protein Ssi03_52260 [Sphaerisporangium siamense]